MTKSLQTLQLVWCDKKSRLVLSKKRILYIWEKNIFTFFGGKNGKLFFSVKF